MAITHNYLETAGYKPTAAEASKAELIPNLADGTLWSENGSGTVVQIGGAVYTAGTGISIASNTINHDSHTGDVTGATALTITDGAVTLAKMANLSTDTFIGRTTAGTGVPEELSKAAALAILNVEDGAEVNNISDVNATDLTDGGDSTLHYHSSDRDRSNHTGTQTASTISDFDTTVSANADVSGSKTITDHISVTQAVDLDEIETRVNELDAAVVLMGTWDASAGTFPGGGTAQAGESWIVSVAGTIDSVEFSADDRIIAITDNASTTTYASNWHKADYTDLVQSVKGNATAAQTGTVVLDPDDFDDSATTNKFVTSSDLTNLSNLSGTNTGDQLVFKTIAVSGESDIVADGTADTLTFAAGSGISITTDAATDSITINSTSTGTTNLGTTYTSTDVTITSSSGDDTTINSAVAGGNSGVMTGADKTKLDYITVTQAVDLDTIESNQTGALLTGEAV